MTARLMSSAFLPPLDKPFEKSLKSRHAFAESGNVPVEVMLHVPEEASHRDGVTDGHTNVNRSLRAFP